MPASLPLPTLSDAPQVESLLNKQPIATFSNTLPNEVYAAMDTMVNKPQTTPPPTPLKSKESLCENSQVPTQPLNKTLFH